MARLRVLGWTAVLALSGIGFARQAVGAPIERKLPPPGIEVSEADRQRLSDEVEKLGVRLRKVTGDGRRRVRAAMAPDIEIFPKAVDYALRHGEFYDPVEIPFASDLLAKANHRLDALAAGKTPWRTRHGRVVRGYRSKLDGSVQPYGLEIPPSLDLGRPCPLYVWLHGRGDKVTDLNFIRRRLTRPGSLKVDDAIVLHPFGRYCNAFKFAGEVDVFEVIEAVCGEYSINRERIVLCGFSMGGAGAWHLGAHHPDRWVALSPGAGFSDTRRYQRIEPKDYPAWYEQTLWGLFDVPDYTRNLFNLPVVAYSGELDKQKQAADLMVQSFAENGRTLPHLIGPGMGHRYHPETLKELQKRLRGFAMQGRDRFPETVSLQTKTLRYNRCHWVEALALGEHWRDARIDATRTDDGKILVKTANVDALRLTDPWGDKTSRPVTLRIDDRTIDLGNEPFPRQGITLQRDDGRWRLRDAASAGARSLRKSPGLQGPIDDVLMEPFLVVTPTGRCANPKVQKWVDAELAHFLDRWRMLFRGEARVKTDAEVTDADLKRYHVISWGDPTANKLTARMLDKLPIEWTKSKLTIGARSYDAASHVPVLVYPNPLPAGAGKYVVLNSGMTFREGHDRTNSLQNPKLPDWAIIDLSQAPDATSPGHIADAAFFDEHWRYKAKRELPTTNTAQ